MTKSTLLNRPFNHKFKPFVGNGVLGLNKSTGVMSTVVLGAIRRTAVVERAVQPGKGRGVGMEAGKRSQIRAASD